MIRLFIRISLGILVVLLSSFFILSWGFLSSRRDDLEDALAVLWQEINLAHHRLEQAKPQELDQEVARLRRSFGYPVQLLDENDARIPAKERLRLRANLPAIVLGRKHGPIFYLPLHGAKRALVMGPMPRFVPSHRPRLLLALAGILGIVGFTGLILATPIVKRIRRLERTAKRISEGDLTARAAITSQDAIGSLAHRFNIMADRVQRLLGQQQQLIQAVTHELRTPIARLRFAAEMVASTADVVERRRRIDEMDGDLEELDQLVQELMFYLRCTDGPPRIALTQLDVAQVLHQLVERAGQQHPALAFRIEPAEGRSTMLLADEKLFKRAIQNILVNALRYASSRIVVWLDGDDQQEVIRICDDGPGIPAQERERIFEPFARADESRSREYGGAGLGLAIVRQILELHGGSVSVREAAGGGACFTMIWPRARRLPSDTK